ncbi:MAG: hypothetical protein FWH11_04840 [Micrococcales bacterium]|nr:hypothetical protein [Micrococcales bacterium]
MTEMVVDTDARGRASLGRPGRRYLMHEDADGTIVLEPATVITDLERRFLTNTALQAQIAEAREHPERQVPRRRRRLDP